MKIINVEGMHCENCVKRITDALNEKGIKNEVSLENGTV
ncbi:MAG: heavy-metal-associated domain-containing protein, partial [Acutalibacteraceae bacterium]